MIKKETENVMNPVISIFKRMKIKVFNKTNNTIIRSLFANLNAVYGEHVRIDQNTYVSKDVTIGDYSYVNAGSRLQNCDIGKFCTISSNVNINPYNHNISGLTTHPIGDNGRRNKRVVIGNDVLISLNVTILEGVHIGDGAVIGAGAVVSHDVGDYEIVGGVPAEFIHYRVSDDKKREVLSQLQWWNLESDRRDCLIRKYRNNLSGIEDEMREV